MGKEKKPKLAIKTSRYFTKSCVCGYEYPNWFVNCPKCGLAWNQSKAKTEAAITEEAAKKKTIKIVVKITEEDFGEALQVVQLIFSADRGKSWYRMKMDTKMDYYIAEIAEVPIGSVIIYYIEVYLASGEKIIENNNGKYFFYEVGVPIAEIKEEPSQPETEVIQENIAQSTMIPQDYDETLEISSEPTEISSLPDQPVNDDITIFGKPQTKIETDLKVCPHCNSKIKKMWSTCPICGGQV